VRLIAVSLFKKYHAHCNKYYSFFSQKHLALPAYAYNKKMRQASDTIPLLLQHALRSARVKQVPSGQIILYEGDTPQDVFILKEGVVKLYDIDDQGSEKILQNVKQPAVIPFAFFSGMHAPLRWFYMTLTDCELYTLPFTELQTITRADSNLAELLTNHFSDDVHELLVRLNSLSKTNTQDKVMAVLWFLMERHSVERRAAWWRIDFPINHQLIADLCGITRESTSIVMKDFQDRKIIRVPKQATLEINRERLSAVK
jgi:CRP-like cAMP-binding protein